MDQRQLKYYLEKDLRIKVVLKNNFQFKGNIIELFDTSFQFQDRLEGVITIPYEEIRFVSEVKDG